MAKSTISMAIFNSYLYVYQRVTNPRSWMNPFFFHLLRSNPTLENHGARAMFWVDSFFWNCEFQVFWGWKGDGCNNLRMFKGCYSIIWTSHMNRGCLDIQLLSLLHPGTASSSALVHPIRGSIGSWMIYPVFERKTHPSSKDSTQ